MASPSPRPSSTIEDHPDIRALQARSERAIATPLAQAVQSLSLLAGLFLAASPWIVGFSGLTTLTVTNLIAGIAFTLLTLGFGSAAYERTHGMGWAALGIGVWTIIAPWVVAGNVTTTRTMASNVAVGAACVCLALATAVLGMTGRRSRSRAHG
ncbi:SPW repeat protein [Streptomyces sp. NPDC087420]|uniref:SPW repeat protein n=1 Tax=Streptomyces sp. NPDC087420 TaxID=3365785 RepID=UPI003834455B